MIKTGIKDSYGREINYMRISITDRCNLRCRYCMPDGAEWIPMKEILTYEEITEVCQEAVKLGITRFKITGGEPLVRRGCPEVIRMIKNIPGTELVTLTTNGLLLGEQLEALLSAGLDAVNISLDTLDIKKYEWITGFDKLAVVLSSIEKAVASGIPVKINAVLQKGMNEEEWLPLTELARKLPLSVRFIEMMPIGYGNMSESISNEELKETIRKHYGNLTEDFRIYGNGPAVYYSIEGFQGNVHLFLEYVPFDLVKFLVIADGRGEMEDMVGDPLLLHRVNKGVYLLLHGQVRLHQNEPPAQFVLERLQLFVHVEVMGNNGAVLPAHLLDGGAPHIRGRADHKYELIHVFRPGVTVPSGGSDRPSRRRSSSKKPRPS